MNAGANEDAEETDVTHLLKEPITIDSPEKGSENRGDKEAKTITQAQGGLGLQPNEAVSTADGERGRKRSACDDPGSSSSRSPSPSFLAAMAPPPQEKRGRPAEENQPHAAPVNPTLGAIEGEPPGSTKPEDEPVALDMGHPPEQRLVVHGASSKPSPSSSRSSTPQNMRADFEQMARAEEAQRQAEKKKLASAANLRERARAHSAAARHIARSVGVLPMQNHRKKTRPVKARDAEQGAHLALTDLRGNPQAPTALRPVRPRPQVPGAVHTVGAGPLRS